MNEIIKICKKHGELTREQVKIQKPKLPHHKPGLICALCSIERTKKYYENNKQKVIDRAETWRLANKEKRAISIKKYNNKPERKIKMKEYEKEYYQKNKEYISQRNNNHRKKPEVKERYRPVSQRKMRQRTVKKYGLTIDQYNEMSLSQNHCCAICKKPETAYDSRLKIIKRLSIDHCHKTNKVRGLLCGRCNMGIGKFEDSIELIKSILDYLIYHK